MGMIIESVKEARSLWRAITALARPIDLDKPVIIGGDPKSPASFDAYTDVATIHININNEAKLEQDVIKHILPLYRAAAPILYDVQHAAPDPELLRAIALDTFLFVHFHEQLHPWLCPNSKEDERQVSKALFDGIRSAEPALDKADALLKVNNCKNLVWDTVLNVSLLHMTDWESPEPLEAKVRVVFDERKRVLGSDRVKETPKGILPVVYLLSAMNNTTDAPISFMGLLYSSLSYNEPGVRGRAMRAFLDDLAHKKIPETTALDIVAHMYAGLVEQLDAKELKTRGIDRTEYLTRSKDVVQPGDASFEADAQYVTQTVTRIFDVPEFRYRAIEGFIKSLAPYIALSQKQGSPDKNTGGGGSGSPQQGDGGGSGSSDDSGDDGGDGDEGNSDQDDNGSGGKGKKGKKGSKVGAEGKEGEWGDGGGAGDGADDDGADGTEENGGAGGKDSKKGKTGKKGKGRGEPTQEEMDEQSMSDTLEDILGTLAEKDADDLLRGAANGGAGSNPYARGGPGGKMRRQMAALSADEYYKRHADDLELKNPRQDNISVNLGNKKIWRLVRSSMVTPEQVAKMNQQSIISFQRATGLPVLMQLPGGYFRLNEYEIKELPIKSYSTQLSGIEIPDNWVFMQDSSGSMTGSSAYIGSGNSFDILQRVKYGFLKGLYTIAKQFKKDPWFSVIDFSDQTVYSGIDSLVKVYDAKHHPIKTVSLSPQCGGTTVSATVFRRAVKDLKPGTSVITLVTDGGIATGADALYAAIEEYAQRPKSAFVFIPVGCDGDMIGQQVAALAKKRKNVLYRPVSDVARIKEALKDVLIQYS